MADINTEIASIHRIADEQLATLDSASPVYPTTYNAVMETVELAEVKMVETALSAGLPVTVALRSEKARRLIGR